MRIPALLFLLALTLGGALLSGCGQKGPLYMPDDPHPPGAPR